MNRRPTGVTLAAVVLGIFSAILVLSAAMLAFLGVFFQRFLAAAPVDPTRPVPPPGAMTAFFVILAVITFLFAVWGIATTIGLVRMKSWARISVIIIGAGLILVGLLTFASTLLSTYMLGIHGVDVQAPPNPAALRVIMLANSLMWLAVAGVGIWYIVYFALRATREAFQSAKATFTAPFPQTPPPTPLSPADFAYAQFVVTPNSPLPEESALLPPAPAVIEPQAPLHPARPVSMTILAILLLIGTACALGQIFITIPVFVAGFILSGTSALIFKLTYAIVTGYAGIGLLLRKRPAWFVAFGLFTLTGIYSCLFLVHSFRARLVDYTNSLSAHMLAGMTPNPPPFNPILDPQILSTLLVVSAIIWIPVIAFLLILLWRARWAYEPHTETPLQP